MEALFAICSAFGLSGAAGLNAYIPLLTIGLMHNQGMLKLTAPYDVLGQWWCLALLGVLLIVEIIVDKIPGADHVNDVVMSFIRPIAGAVIFASQAGVITQVHPGVWLCCGLVLTGGVHGIKAMVRPVINFGTMGLGAPIVSIVEDFVSTILSIIAILLPVLAAILVFFFGWAFYRMFKKQFGGWKKENRVYRVRAIPVEVEATAGRR